MMGFSFFDVHMKIRIVSGFGIDCAPRIKITADVNDVRICGFQPAVQRFVISGSKVKCLLLFFRKQHIAQIFFLILFTDFKPVLQAFFSESVSQHRKIIIVHSLIQKGAEVKRSREEIRRIG